MSNNEMSKLEKIQKALDAVVDGFGNKARINKINFSEWMDMYNIYLKSQALGLDTISLASLASSLLSANIIVNSEDLQVKYEKACTQLETYLSVSISNEDYDENGLLKPEKTWTESEKRRIMGSNISFEEPKVLTPYDSLERGKALSQSLSSDFENYKQGMQHKRDERYQSMIDELPPVESPMNRRNR